MGEKSIQKKQYILETARKVFMEKGYKNVTMKDIVDACDISRGGLYLYFESTKEIFEGVLEMETQETDDTFAGNITLDSTASEILALFLKEQKKEMLRKTNNLSVAAYEYLFENKIPKKDNIVRQQFDTAVKILQRVLEDGVESGEFYCEDTIGMARNIMFVVEGLKIASLTMSLSEDMINKEFMFIMRGLAAEEEV